MKRNFKKIIIITILLGTLLSVIVFTDLFSTREAEGAWYSTGGTWTNRKLITVDNTKVSGSSNLTDFPMLVSVTDSDLRHTGSGGKVGKTDGTDILFTSSDGTTKLSHEIERYVSTTGELVAWVKIPTLSYNTDTEIYIYYGNSGASDQQNITSVWSNYVGVWHLNQDPSGSAPQMLDSGPNALHLTSNGSMTTGDLIAGKIAGAIDFDGTDDRLYRNHEAALSIGGYSITMQAWVYDDGGTNSGNILGKTSSIWTYGLIVNHASQLIQTSFTTGASCSVYGGVGGLNFMHNKWTQFSVTYDGSNIRLYTDGSQAGTCAFTSAIPTNTNNFAIGDRTNATTNPWDDGIDEVRLSTNVLGADWIATEYNNMNSPSTFYTFSSEEEPPIDTVPNVLVRNKDISYGWYSTGGTWTHRKLITVDNTKVSGSSNLTDFPMLVSVTDSDLRHTGSGGKVGKTDGTDILFTSSDGTTKLSHEIERYVSSTGELVAWVKIPTLSYNSETPIYMYFGNSGASDQQDIANVWTGYRGAWHLKDGTTLNSNDSTSNANNGTASNVTAVAGKIDGAGSFNGSTSSINVGSASSLDDVGSQTMSSWIYVVGAGQNGFGFIYSKTPSGSSDGPRILTVDNPNPQNRIGFGFNSSGSAGRPVRETVNDIYTRNSWAYVVGTWDGSLSATGLKIYVDGVEAAYSSGTDGVTAIVSDAPDTAFIGNRTGGARTFNGRIDNMRVYAGVRSSDWVMTEYNNQNSPSSFYGYGGLESLNRETGSGGAPAKPVNVRGGVKFR